MARKLMLMAKREASYWEALGKVHKLLFKAVKKDPRILISVKRASPSVVAELDRALEKLRKETILKKEEFDRLIARAKRDIRGR